MACSWTSSLHSGPPYLAMVVSGQNQVLSLAQLPLASSIQKSPYVSVLAQTNPESTPLAML